MTLTPNIPLLKKVLERIETAPQAFNMDSWESRALPGDEFWNPSTGGIEEVTECGTTRCVAGWAEWIYATEEGWISPDQGAYQAMYAIASRERIIPEHHHVGSRILGVPSDWFYLPPGDVVGKIREVIRRSEAGESFDDLLED